MIYAVTRLGTTVIWSKRHFCEEHQNLVDDKHIEECHLISKYGRPTKYNSVIENQSEVFGTIKTMSKPLIEQVVSYYGWLTKMVT